MLDRLRSALADRYAIEREIGSGGMATVYLAHDIKHDRKVALKVMRPELSAILGGERFLREIRIAAKLNHPHILALHDSGETDGFLYYVMPHVEGESLRAKIDREKQLSIDEAVSLTRQVASALHYAHQQGVIHRDIKPENILLHRGEAVVADFGIALAVTVAGGERLTETGLSLGTPEYMSPEQASSSGGLDARTDIYSLGAVLYEMVTGEPPQTGATVQAVIAKLLSERPTQPSVVRDSVPEAMDRAIMKALAKVPADRFATARGFADALTAEDVGGSAGRGRSIAVLPFANLSADPDQEYFADGITEEIINALTQLEDLRVAARTSSFSFKGKSPEIAEVGEKLKVETVLEGSVRKAGNRLRITAQLVDVDDGYHVWSEQYDRELDDVFAVQEDIARVIADRLRLSVANRAAPLVKPPTDNIVAYTLYIKGRFLQRQHGEGPGKSLEYFRQALALDPDFALAHAGLADAYVLLGVMGLLPPKQVMPEAKQAATRALEIDDTLADAHVALAWVSMQWDYDSESAKQHFLRALELDPRHAEAHSRYAVYLLSARGPSEAALMEARKGVELDPLAEPAHSWLGLSLSVSRQLDEAITRLKHASELDPTSFHPHHLLSEAYRLNSMYPEAIASAETAMALAGRNPWSLGVLGLTHAAAGNLTEANAILGELLECSRRENVSWIFLAALYAALGRKDEAFAALDRAYEERDGLITVLKFWPHFDPVRDDPRFDELLERVGYW